MKFLFKVTKKELVDLIEKVVFRTIEDLEIDDPKIELYLAELAITLLLIDKDEVKFFLTKHKEFRNRIDLKPFLLLHKEWLQNKIEDIQMSEDEFFELDGEEIDETISKMHYQDHQKISALEFMKEGIIDNEFISELSETLNSLDELLYQFEDVQIDKSFIEKLTSLNSFIRIFEFSIEFRDIAYSLETLKEKLILLEIDTLLDEQKFLLKEFIKTIIDDLKKWFEEVIINQTAQDIHYLDASLLANIAQMDIMLANVKDDDEIEFF